MYLTTELKAYYMQDFNKNVLNCQDDFWKLDDNLRDLFIKINKNQNVQTLYSRRMNTTTDPNKVSMLWILYSAKTSIKTFKAFKKEITKSVPSFRGGYNYHLHTDFDNKVKMGCMNDKKYFKHGALMLTMKSQDLNEHKLFWDIIEKHLPNF
jgi:hypothetical protein